VSWGIVGAWRRGAAGEVEEAVVALVHLLHQPQQVRFTLARRLALVPGFPLPFEGGVLVGLSGCELLTQQVALHPQQIPLLLHREEGLLLCGWSVVLRAPVAWCCILERWSAHVWHCAMERVACTQQFSGVEMAIRVQT
jgi:hypothetical protein